MSIKEPEEHAVRPEYLAHLSALEVSYWRPKDADEHGMSLRVLQEMADQGLVEPVYGGKWVATPEGQRMFKAKGKGR